jgi:Bardet-Biedl syndrome 7 protein
MLLSRRDYLQVSGTSRGILSLLTDQGRPSLIIGDQGGQLTSFNFDTLSVSWSSALKPISHVEVSGNTILASGGPFVYSYTSSGLELSCFDTNVAESVKTFKVQGQEVWTSGKYLFNHYLKEKELDYLILKDTINDFCVGNITGELVFNPVLACNDKSVRVLNGSDTVYSLALPNPASCLHSLPGKKALFGSNGGAFGELQLYREQGVVLWTNPGRSSEVSFLHSSDLLGQGSPQILVSRVDGSLEVYSRNSSEIVSSCETSVQESITTLLPGNHAGHPEVFLSTYSGKIIGIRDNSKNLDFNPSSTLTSEINSLKQKLEESKKQVHQPSKTQNQSKVSYKLSVLAEQAAYNLTIESQFAMSFILINSEIPIELLDSEDHEATVTSSEEDGAVLITYRFPDSSSTRCQILFRNSEGQPGSLNIYVIPYQDPKVAQLLTVDIKPLSLHEKVLQVDVSDRPLNLIRITGNFTKSEMHGWISQTLPDVPPSVNEDIVQMFYSNSIIGSLLCISYASAWAEFSSESVSVLAILKESLMKQSALRKVQLSVSFNEAKESCGFVISMIESFIVELQELETKFQLIEAMKEIEIQGDISKFSSELTGILEQADGIKAEYKKYPKKLQYFQGMISDLYVDYCKFRGFLNFPDRIPHLQNLLANFDAEALIEFFNN